MASFIDYVSADGMVCSEYYNAYAESIKPQQPMQRDAFDSLVSAGGYVKSRPSIVASKDRRWRWKKL